MNSKQVLGLKIIVPICLLATGLMGFRALTASKPMPKRQKPVVPAPMVSIMRVQIGPQPVTIHGQGTVRPLREIQLVSQVSGKVIYMSRNLVNGGTFEKDDTLLRIEPVDYELAVILAESQVKDAESRLKLSQEESVVAREEWIEHHAGTPTADRQPSPLVVKEPQLKAAQARLEADRANLKRALLNLERTALKAPFPGKVSGKRVDIGQYIAPGQALATLYSTEAVEIVLPFEDEKLFWFHVPGLTPGRGSGASATVRAEVTGRALSWKGQVVRAEGKIDEQTRMINVIVRVDDPYASKPPLAVGLFVKVDIDGHVLENTAIVPRSAIHGDDTVWVFEGDCLRFRTVDVARFFDDQAMIQDGLKDGDRVVLTPIDAVTDGMAVRVLTGDGRSTS